MRSPDKFFYSTHQNVLIFLAILITLFGLTLKVQAQAPLIGTDAEKFNKSMKLSLSGSDFSVVIPKVTQEELAQFKSLVFDQLVYVSDKEAGFYQYQEGAWEKVTVIAVLKEIESNITLMEPSLDSMILSNALASNKQYLDYNNHIGQVQSLFNATESEDNFAIESNDR